MPDFDKMNLRELLATVTELRAGWNGTADDPNPFELRGYRFSMGVIGSVSRAEIVGQCNRLSDGMQAHNDKVAAEYAERRAPHTVSIADTQGTTRYLIRYAGLIDMPRRIRLLAFAYVGLTDVDI